VPRSSMGINRPPSALLPRHRRKLQRQYNLPQRQAIHHLIIHSPHQATLSRRRHWCRQTRFHRHRNWHTLHSIWSSHGNVPRRGAHLLHHDDRKVVKRCLSKIHSQTGGTILTQCFKQNATKRKLLYHTRFPASSIPTRYPHAQRPT